MTTMERLVYRVRGMLQAGQPEDLSALAEPYVPGSGVVVLRYPRRNLGAGGIVSVGLTTFQTLEADSDGATYRGVAGIDGSPDVAAAAGSIVRVKPTWSTFSIFDEMTSVARALSSPKYGLFQPVLVEPTSVNRRDNTYVLPVMDPPAQRLLQVRWRMSGTEAWNQTGNAEYVPQENTVRVFGSLPDAGAVQFIMATGYGVPTALSDDADTLGFSNGLDELLTLGAASSLSITTEGRRNSLVAQGDARRSEEVGAGAHLNLSIQWGREFQERVDAEFIRLHSIFGGYTRNRTAVFDQQWPLNFERRITWRR